MTLGSSASTNTLMAKLAARRQAERLHQIGDMGVRVLESHAARLGDEMRRLRERNRVQPAADAIAGFEQRDAKMRALLAQAPGRIYAGDATTDDHHIEVHRRGLGTRGERRGRERSGTRKKAAPRDLHRVTPAGWVAEASRAPGLSFEFSSLTIPLLGRGEISSTLKSPK